MAKRKQKKNSKSRPTRKNRKGMRLPLAVLLIAAALAVAAVSAVSVRRFLLRNASTAVARESTLGNYYSGTLVVARNERVTEAESNTTVDFVAAEGSHVSRGDTICRVYSSGYDQTEINRLQNYREEIQAYHVGQVFSSYVDAALDSENREIDSLAQQVRTMVNGKGVGSLSNLERQLTSAMAVRKNYLKQKYPDDQTLNELYKIENDQLKKIESWTTTYTATEDCRVSFYTDGFESMLNGNTYQTLTPEEAKQVIRGILPERTTVSRGNSAIFRTVNEDEWYALFLCQDRDWNPVVGENYQMQLSGFDNYVVRGVVESFSRIGSDLLLRMRVPQQSVVPMLNIRTCNATVGDFVSGIHVPIRALYTLDNTIGVVVQDGSLQTFVAVTVISYPDSETAFVRPTLEGSPLMDGKTILLF